MAARWMVLLTLLAACCIWGSAAIAGEPPVPIEGMLLVTGFDLEGGTNYGHFMHGTSDTITPWPGDTIAMQHMVVSPLANKVAYQETVAASPDGSSPASATVWTAAIDGTGAVNLTEVAGMTGVNCFPDWSPDGSKILFQHSDPVGSQPPCEAGFRLWIMDADGGNAHEVAPHVSSSMFEASWAPNAARLLCRRYEGGDINNGEAITIGTDGSSIVSVPNNVGVGEDWSPDGSLLASSWGEPGVVDGEPGVWRQLRVTNADGSNPRALVSHFISDADMALYDALHPDDPAGDRVFIGPVFPKWSPKGDRIAFLAAMPFDPEGPWHQQQVEVFIYSLASGDLTKITDDQNFDAWLSWGGENTFADSSQVTVDSTTVSFAEVTAPGLTTIVCDADPPEVPTGSRFDYAFYELKTTAGVTGPIAICMTYTDEEVPPAAEADLAILHWDGVEWVDITTSRDPANNVICAETESLSRIALHGIRVTRFPDVPAWGYGTDGLDPYWAYYQVMACVQARIVSGYGDGTYQPTNSVSRDQMAVFISRAMAGGDENVPPGPETATFDDVPTDYWAYDYVEYCVANDIVQGYTPDTYGPADLVNRDAMAVFIARAHADGDANVPDGPTEATFDDVPTDYWSYKYIEYCVANNIVQGYDPVTYGPSAVVSRDQMAVFICRAFDLPI